jgi:hypothetical protein
MAETTRQRKFKEFNKAQDERDYQKELKDRYDTGTTDEDIAVAKQKQKEQSDMLMKQAAALAGPKKEEKEETPMDAIRALGESATKKPYKKGGMVKKMAKGGTASSRADGCCVRGKTRA